MTHRELRRVPLDFAWPLRTVWGGYLNPHYAASTKCPDCDGSGYSPTAKLYSDQWYGNADFDPVAYGATPLTVDHPGVQAAARRNVERSPDYYGRSGRAIEREAHRLFAHWRGQWCHHLIQADVDALVADGRLMDFTRTPRDAGQAFIVAIKMAFHNGNSWLPDSNGYTPTADEVNAWSLTGFSHDGINHWICVKARCAREGVTVECPRCAGSAEMWATPEAKDAAEAWESTEPPAGDGYQLWETCSEGSPITPVFATLDELCAHAATNCTTFASYTATAEEWRRMLDAGYVAHVEQIGNVTAVF